VKESFEGAVQRPEDRSFAEIFRQHMPAMWRALVGLGVREADADDVCQEVMLVVHRRLPEFDGRALKSWLYGICLRAASDYRRSARVRREQPTERVPDELVPATQAEAVDGRRAMRQLFCALDQLDPDKRAAFVLFEIEGLTLRELAETMQCPLQTAYSRLQAARDHVRVAFAREPRVRSA
jgi:RNA polymerase sigma-70 factor (ECF subfamily)